MATYKTKYKNNEIFKNWLERPRDREVKRSTDGLMKGNVEGGE